ncbi:MAG TPA: DUF5988 family protein [Actinocrinis sp.]|uniref:DUF5988 family protein n=1 Tax=Actinocrinis sp. TaxID=1920516 RepID=UPI002DDCCF7D|nr:DUF5988 family protein [Actinocrinis sp.]HEV3172086.1 DUF5988 family protein [Actinocrinis sp.]
MRAILIGGPANFPDGLHIRALSRQNDKIKATDCGGYDHFERRSEFEIAGGLVAVRPVSDHEIPFGRTMRTAAAE